MKTKSAANRTMPNQKLEQMRQYLLFKTTFKLESIYTNLKKQLFKKSICLLINLGNLEHE